MTLQFEEILPSSAETVLPVKLQLIDMIQEYYENGPASGIQLHSDKECAILSDRNWETELSVMKDSIVFIDEGNAHTKRYLIQRERTKLNRRKNEKFKSVLYPLISSMRNCEQFKYGVNDIWDMHIFAFYDSIKRVKKIRYSDALIGGLYSNGIDRKSVSQDDLDWLGSLD